MTIKGKITSINLGFNGTISVQVENNIRSFSLNRSTIIYHNGKRVKTIRDAKVGDNVSIDMLRNAVGQVHIGKG